MKAKQVNMRPQAKATAQDKISGRKPAEQGRKGAGMPKPRKGK